MWRGVAGRAGAAVAVLVCATGCWATNPAVTTMDDSPPNGMQAQLGEVELHSVVIVAAAADQQGRVLGTLVNNGPLEVTLRIAADGATTRVRIPAQGLVQLENITPVLLERAGADPGLMAHTEFTTADESRIIAVPVFDATLDHYAPFLPHAGPATGTAPPHPGQMSTREDKL